MKFSIKDFFSKCDQIRSFLRILSHILKKSLMENFCAVRTTDGNDTSSNYGVTNDNDNSNGNLRNDLWNLSS